VGQPTNSKSRRGAVLSLIGRGLRIALAVALVAGLAVLYVMSEGGELKRQTQIATYLRQLREVDAGWNREVAAARSDALSAEARPRQAVALQPILDGLVAETAALDSRPLSDGVAALRAAFLDKARALNRFASDNEALRAQLRDLQSLVAAARQAATQSAKSVPIAQRTRLATMENQLLSLNTDLLRLYVQPEPAVRESVGAMAASLLRHAEAYPDPLRGAVAALGDPVQKVLRAEPALSELSKQIALLPTGPRVSSMSDAVDRHFEAVADEKERYRVYLVFYSAALLVFLASVLWQLGRSYVKINQANEALKVANENLEHRVDERTKELSEALKHLKESETLLVQTEKMSSLGQMVAGIAHEINTPLAYVKSSLDALRERLPVTEAVVLEGQKLLALLQKGDAPDEELSRQFALVSELTTQFQADEAAARTEAMAEDALHGIHQISEIILSLKNFSRLDRSKVSRFDLNEGLESTLVIARNLVKHKTVRKRFAQIPLIECAPSQINQVFLNLITNAAQATDDQTGELTLATGVAGGSMVRVDIGDNGHGIPQNIMSKIFDPFFTTKEVGQGTGLGLSIAYKIVQEHGGRIEVKSDVGMGTTFSVFLPVKSSLGQAPASAAQPATA
jgi:signal transduction histidine kinase